MNLTFELSAFGIGDSNVKFAPLLLFTLVNSITPGPNNMILAASGARFGYVRSLPFIFGILTGIPLMTFAVGFGPGELFQRYPLILECMKWAGGIYLLYLAYRIAMAGAPDAGPALARPIGYLESALLQWVNPKGWLMITLGVTLYATAGNSYYPALVAIAAVFAAVSFPVASLWCGLGAAIRLWLRGETAIRTVNLVMAAGLIAAAGLSLR